MRRSKCLLLIMILSAVSMRAAGQNIDHWETVVYDSLIWEYFPGTTQPEATWNSLTFDDAAWLSGKGGFGYSDNDDRTVISPVMSVYTRIKFSIDDLSKIEQAVLNVDYDDGFVAYINGVEVARSLMSSTAFDAPSTGTHEARMFQGLAPESFIIRKNTLTSLLVEGENVLGVEVHNENGASSDLTAAAFLTLGINDKTNTYGPLPSWFVAPFVFKSSNLPIVIINTNNQEIQDEIRITADMQIIYNGQGVINRIADPPNNYTGKISVEYRGESSQLFPKKSMTIETQNTIGENVNVSLVDMPEENDWILYAPYTDKTMLRDVLSYKIGNDMGQYAPRTRFVELYLNDEYYGVYVLIEKIKIDDNRVDIASLKPEDISGDELTGGYILRKDKIDETDYPAWNTATNFWRTSYQFVDPEGDELVDGQRNYIKGFMNEFELSLWSDNYKDETTGYRKYVDVPSFIQFSLVNELSKNVDGYQFSTYMYKDKDSRDGKLHMGPLWDFNLAYGNVNYTEASMVTTEWLWDERIGWWKDRLILDPYYTGMMKCTWLNMRAGKLKDDRIVQYIDSVALVLDEAQKRNYERWPILGQYVWPNQYVGNTYQDEIAFLKQWLLDRLAWMDDNMPGICDDVSAIGDPYTEHSTSVHPNPSSTSFFIDLGNPELQNSSIEIYNSVGGHVLSVSTHESGFIWDSTNGNGERVSPGLYIVNVYKAGKRVGFHRIIKL